MNLQLKLFNKDITKYIIYIISFFLVIYYYFNNKLLSLIFFIILSGVIYYYYNNIVIALTLSIIISNLLISLKIIEGNDSDNQAKALLEQNTIDLDRHARGLDIS